MGETRRAVISGCWRLIGRKVDGVARAGWKFGPREARKIVLAGFLNHVSNSRLEIARGDIRDPDFLATQLRAGDTVFHLAASISIPHSYEAPRDCINTNVLGTLNLLEACRKANIRRLIHASTSEVYDAAAFVPMDESHPIRTRSPYAASKHAADKLVQTIPSRLACRP